MRHRYSLCVLACLFALSACRQAESPAPTTANQAPDEVQAPARGTWDEFVNRQIEDYLAAHPAWAVTQGRHEFDGQLPDWSAEGLAREAGRLAAARATALAYTDEELDATGRYQREYFVARIDHDLFWLEKARWPFRNPAFYMGWLSDSLSPDAYISLDYAPVEQRMAAFNRYLKNVPLAAQQIRLNLQMPMPRTWLQFGIDAFGGFATYFRDEVPAVWAEVQDPGLQQDFATANAAAITAMQDLAQWLQSNMANATDDYALGAELFQQMLWDTERVDTPLAELEAIGRADMARNLQGLRDACAEFAPGADIRDCFARMADRKPDGSPVEAAREQLGEIREFMVAENLASIPGEEEALVDEAPPYARSNFAYISIPGPWERNQPSVYYISPPNPAWPEEVQADYIAGEADLLFTSVHEVWPGHFLNFMHANRSPWIFGRAFVNYAFGEGWAHYTEEMMVEAGLRGADPETRIGQISNALLRNARYLSAIGLHTQGWSVEDSKRFFMEEGFQSEGTAIQQAARGTYDPAYLNYTMGKLMIRQLREDWTASRGGRAAWREFHDTFLSYGGPPIPLVRQQMMGEDRPRAVFAGAPQTTGPAVEPQLNWAWNCADGRYLVTSHKDDALWLFLPDRTEQLALEVSGSGAKYSTAAISFWSKGDDATLTEGEASTNCRLDRRASIWEDAKLRGADFRGQGNEPGWHLELFSGQASVLVTDYGQRRETFTAGDAVTVGANSIYSGLTTDGDAIRVVLAPGPCQDSMADEDFATGVRVELDGIVLNGCGNPLH